MAINPVPTSSPAPTAGVSYEQEKKYSGSTSAAFDTILSSLRSGNGAGTGHGQQAAAELLRIEMMQSSLSLSGAGQADRLQAMPALAALLAGSSQYCAASSTAHSAYATAAASQVPSADAAPTTEAAATKIERTAAHFLGTPYRFGGEGADGIDCSSFVQQVFREHQIDLPRTAREQSKVGSDVAEGELQKGDLVFFHTYASYPSHVGIYLGEGKMIHASSGKGEVTVSDMNSSYYRSRFMGARRVG